MMALDWLARIASRLAPVVRTPRPAEQALAAAFLLGLLVYLPIRLTFGRDWIDESLQRLPQLDAPSAGAVSEGEIVVRLPTPPYVTAVPTPGSDARNPFAFKPKPPPPTPISTATPVVIETPTPVPLPPTPPPPPPYTSPFSLIGLAGTPDRKVVFLKANDVVYVALEGHSVEFKRADGRGEKHLIKSIGVDKVKIGPMEGEGEVTLELKSGR